MRPPRALPAAHFDRNERYAYFGDRTLARWLPEFWKVKDQDPEFSQKSLDPTLASTLAKNRHFTCIFVHLSGERRTGTGQIIWSSTTILYLSFCCVNVAPSGCV